MAFGAAHSNNAEIPTWARYRGAITNSWPRLAGAGRSPENIALAERPNRHFLILTPYKKWALPYIQRPYLPDDFPAYPS